MAGFCSRPTTVHDKPEHFMIALDISSSMERSLPCVKNALLNDGTIPWSDFRTHTVYAFNHTVSELTSPNHIRSLEAGGYTDIGKVLNALIKGINTKTEENSDVTILFISDGQDSNRYAIENKFMFERKERTIRVKMISVGSDGDVMWGYKIHGLLDTMNGNGAFFVRVDTDDVGMEGRLAKADEYKDAIKFLICRDDEEGESNVVMKLTPDMTVKQMRKLLQQKCNSTLKELMMTKGMTPGEVEKTLSAVEEVLNEVETYTGNRALKLTTNALKRFWSRVRTLCSDGTNGVAGLENRRLVDLADELTKLCSEGYSVALSRGNVLTDPKQAFIAAIDALTADAKFDMPDVVDPEVKACAVTFQSHYETMQRIQDEIRSMDPKKSFAQLLHEVTLSVVLVTIPPNVLSRGVKCPWKYRFEKTAWEFESISEDSLRRLMANTNKTRENLSTLTHGIPVTHSAGFFGSKAFWYLCAARMNAGIHASDRTKCQDTLVATKDLPIALAAALAAYSMTKGELTARSTTSAKVANAAFGPGSTTTSKAWCAYMDAIRTLDPNRLGDCTYQLPETEDLNKALFAMLCLHVETNTITRERLQAWNLYLYHYVFINVEDPAIILECDKEIGGNLARLLDEVLGDKLAAAYTEQDAKLAAAALLSPETVEATLKEALFKALAKDQLPLDFPEKEGRHGYKAYNVFGYTTTHVDNTMKALGLDKEYRLNALFALQAVCTKTLPQVHYDEEGRPPFPVTQTDFHSSVSAIPALWDLFQKKNRKTLGEIAETWAVEKWTKSNIDKHMEIPRIKQETLDAFYALHPLLADEIPLYLSPTGLFCNACSSPICPKFGLVNGTPKKHSVGGHYVATTKTREHIDPSTVRGFHRAVFANPESTAHDIEDRVRKAETCHAYGDKNQEVIVKRQVDLIGLSGNLQDAIKRTRDMPHMTLEQLTTLLRP